jgi:hypothetical protein
MARVSNAKMERKAAPVREALRQLIKKQLKTLKDRQDLANYMGASIHYVNSMLYRGEGGLDAWINAALFCTGIDTKRLIAILEDTLSHPRKR